MKRIAITLTVTIISLTTISSVGAESGSPTIVTKNKSVENALQQFWNYNAQYARKALAFMEADYQYSGWSARNYRGGEGPFREQGSTW